MRTGSLKAAATQPQLMARVPTYLPTSTYEEILPMSRANVLPSSYVLLNITFCRHACYIIVDPGFVRYCLHPFIERERERCIYGRLMHLGLVQNEGLGCLHCRSVGVEPSNVGGYPGQPVNIRGSQHTLGPRGHQVSPVRLMTSGQVL